MSEATEDVEAANAAFYAAFETRDLEAMDRVWAHGEHVRCVHPGWPLLAGWAAVRASWEAIFAGGAEMSFSITDVRALVAGELSWVTCTENILSAAGGQVVVTSILATNLFERGPDGWRMVHHHASHVLGEPGAA
ncbi:MAG TPA: nuclear transport factor 2 family protein [Methylomirabilota bacterium]|nr:nuclear transport factor 2 family protein [Methylomirabilota bacterium]